MILEYACSACGTKQNVDRSFSSGPYKWLFCEKCSSYKGHDRVDKKEEKLIALPEYMNDTQAKELRGRWFGGGKYASFDNQRLSFVKSDGDSINYIRISECATPYWVKTTLTWDRKREIRTIMDGSKLSSKDNKPFLDVIRGL